MFFGTKAFLAVLSSALVVHAQSPTSLPAGVDPCILNCVTSAASSAGCSSFTDLNCLCTSTAFQNTALQCLQTSCTQADVQTAIQLQQQECSGYSSSGVSSSTSSGLSSVSTPTSSTKTSSTSTSNKTSSTSSTKTSSTGTPTTSSSSAAMALSVPFSFGSFVGTLIASAGALVGAALVL